MKNPVKRFGVAAIILWTVFCFFSFNNYESWLDKRYPQTGHGLFPGLAFAQSAGNQRGIAYGGCDGVHDDTAGINTLIAAPRQNVNVILPVGTCTINGTLTMSGTYNSLVGQGPAATHMVFTAGTGDAIQIGSFVTSTQCTSGATAPAACTMTSGNIIRDVWLDAGARTGGTLLNFNGVANGKVFNVIWNGWKLMAANFVNSITVRDAWGFCMDTASSDDGCLTFVQTIISGATYYVSNTVNLDTVVVNASKLGANCMEWDGPFNTLNIHNLTLLGCANGVQGDNTANSTTLVPDYFFADQLFVDGSVGSALVFNSGSEVHVTNSAFDCLGNSATTSGTGALVIAHDTHMTGGNRAYDFSNSSFFNCPGALMRLGGYNIHLSNNMLYGSNTAATASFPSIDILATAEDVTIAGGATSNVAEATHPTYGVTVESGAVGIALTAIDYNKAATNNVNNLSAATIGMTGGISKTGTTLTQTSCAATTAC